MFKAKLIGNESYYPLKRRQILFLILPSIPIGFLVNFYSMPLWLTLLMVAVYILIIVLLFRDQRKINALTGENILEIDGNEIRIKSVKGNNEKVIHLDTIDKLVLKENYDLPKGNFNDDKSDLFGEVKKHFLVIKKGKQERNLDFEIDSYYMVNQLNKQIKLWEERDISIEKV